MHAEINHPIEIETSIQDVRMALQDCGALGPEKCMEDEEFEGEEDMRGVEEFLAWITGMPNEAIRRVASEVGDAANEDYLSGTSSFLSDINLALMFFSSQKEAQYNGRRSAI
jgi:transcription initiation factor TFIID subunit 3